MQQDSGNRIKILSRRFEEGENYHSEKKHGEVAEEDRKRMAHQQIKKTLTGGSLPELFTGHDGKRTDVGAAQFAIMAVMIIMRTAPNGAGADKTNAEQTHENFGRTGPGQNRAVLLVMINHKQPEHQQPGQDAAGHAPDQGQPGKSSCGGRAQEKRRGKNAPPASPG